MLLYSAPQITFMISLWIFLGGGFGAICRYYINIFSTNIWSVDFPLGTLLANLIASFILGIGVSTSSVLLEEPYRSGLVIGFCGGFSTFSSFSNENLQLLQHGQWGALSINIILNVVLCMLAVLGGLKLGFQLFR